MDTHNIKKTKPRERDHRDRDNQDIPPPRKTIQQRLTRIQDQHLADTIFRLWLAIILLFVLWAYSTYMMPNKINNTILEAYIELQKTQATPILPYGLNLTIN